MPKLAYEFYRTVMDVMDHLDTNHKTTITFPFITSGFICNTAFTPEWLVHHIQSQKPDEPDDEVWRDGGHCFQYIFEEFMDNEDMVIICDSQEIGEWEKDLEYGGDHRYFYGYMPNETAYIYHQGQAEMFELPHRLTIYGKEFTIELRSDSKHIEIYKTIQKIRNIFFLPSHLNKTSGLRQMLRNSDRKMYED